MADGRVANITYQTNPDLYFALRGGANNFGIVTKFHLETHPLGEMWGGVKVYPAAANLTLSKAVETFLDNAHTDPDASIIASYSYRDGNFSTSCIFDHAKPQANPPIFDAFLALENEKTFDSTRTANLTSFTNELNSGVPKGFRQRFTTATFKNSAALQSQVIDIFVSEVNAIQGSITNRTGFNPIISFEPIFTAPREVLNRNGGNAFSPPTTDGPWMFVLFSFTWASVTDDANVLRAIENLTNRSIAAAKAKGLLTEYIYLNDAGPEQLPFEGYGAGNLQRLRQISKKYDPEAIFQRLLPGGFKLGIDGKY
ncbi:hypothetical protein MMC16_000917 [Acarospora aff. strigata]|nr:hypothetical protein [Acarospora aff. strigata]